MYVCMYVCICVFIKLKLLESDESGLFPISNLLVWRIYVL